MTIVKFTATKLASGKKGILKPDEEGYYTMPVGGLNVFNSAGQYYTLEGAKELFTASSIFMRRVANGCLKGEVGHPKRAPGMSMDDYMNRILTIEETNVCCHFKEIWLDENFGKNNPTLNNPSLVAIMAKIKPSGPKSAFLKEAFETSHENVCFSIRALTRDYYQRGQCNRELRNILTFDAVVEGGISIASKFQSSALESFEEITLTKPSLERLVNKQPQSMALESTCVLATECLTTAFPETLTGKPLYSKW